MAPMKREAGASNPELIGTVSLSQIARRWHTNRKIIRRLLGSQRIAFIQIRGRFRIPWDEIRRLEGKPEKLREALQT